MALPPMLVWAVSSPAMAYVYYGVMKLPRGGVRLVAAVPLIAFYVSVAWGFDTVFERGVYSFFFIWLTSFKIVLLCWDDGPAADPWAVATFPRFLAVMTLSLQIKRQKFSDRSRKENSRSEEMKEKRKKLLKAADSRRDSPSIVGARDGESSAATGRVSSHGADVDAGLNGDASSSEAQTAYGWVELLKRVDDSQEMLMVLLRLLFKFLCLIVMTYAIALTPTGLLPLIYSFYIYIACSVIFEGIAALVSPLMGIELEPSFNKPFLAHSLANFWGQRWNLLVSNLLRVSVYDPVLRFLLWWSEGPGSNSAPHPSKRMDSASGRTPLGTLNRSPGTKRLPLWARSASMFSCFLVSGLMHELIYQNLTRRKPSWEVTFFFILNGAAAILEGALGRTTSVKLPKYVSTPLTLSFVLVTAIWLFFPPLLDSDTADRAIAEFRYFFNALFHMVGAS